MMMHQVMEETANGILKEIPHPVDLEAVTAKYPVLYEQSMNTVLIQEIIRLVTVSRVKWQFLLAIHLRLCVFYSVGCLILPDNVLSFSILLSVKRNLAKKLFK